MQIQSAGQSGKQLARQPNARRAAVKPNAAERRAGANTRTVQHGLLLQEVSSTVCAIEFLLARNVDAAVIRRVLSGTNLRREDRLALDKAKGAAAGNAPV